MPARFSLVPAHRRRQPLHRRRLTRVVASHGAGRTTGPRSRRYLAEIARAADRLGYEGVLTPTGNVVRGRLADRVGAARRDGAAEVPRGVPARAGTADAGRPADRDAAAVLRGPGAAQHRQRRRRPRAAPVRRLGRPRRALRPHRRIPAHRADRSGRQDSVDFKGQFYDVADARVSAPPDPLPQIYFGGSSAAALPIAAEHVDVYLTWGEPPQAAAAKIAEVRTLAEQRGRKVRFGIRLHTISRDTSEAAWAVADEMLPELTPEQIAKATAAARPLGIRRAAAHDRAARRPDRPGWRSIRTCGRGSDWCAAARAPRWSAATKRSPTSICEYHALGFDEFILSGYPHLEEAYWFAEGRACRILKRKGVA